MNLSVLKKINRSWIKDNLSLIILTPTILGGIWQLTELALIGIPYIRFFSVAQLVPDGLLSLIFLSMLTLFILLMISMINKIDDPEKKDKPAYIGLIFGSAFWLALLVYLFVNILNALPGSSGEKSLLMAFAGIVGILIIDIIFLLFLETREFAGRTVSMDHPLIKGFKFITLSVLLASFMVVALHGLKALRDLSLFPENLKNMENITCKMKRSKNVSDSSKGTDPADKIDYAFEIIYFNDKYLFIKTTESSFGSVSKTFIEVLKFDDLMNSEACK